MRRANEGGKWRRRKRTRRGEGEACRKATRKRKDENKIAEYNDDENNEKDGDGCSDTSC